MHSIRQCQGARICPEEPCISYPSEEIRQTTQQVLMQAYHLNSPEIFMVPREKQKPAVTVGAALDDSQLNQDENHKLAWLHRRHSEPVQIVEKLVDGCSTQRQVFLVARPEHIFILICICQTPAQLPATPEASPAPLQAAREDSRRH